MSSSQSYNLNTLITTYAGQDPQGDTTELNQAALVTLPSPLRIAMHYYWETDATKLTLLKSLGYNCIIISRQVTFLTDTARTLAFLDKMFTNGISVMFYIDVTQLTTSGTPNAYTNWFTAIKDHNAIIAFGHYDEPFDQNMSIATTTNAYNTLKSFSDKPVFVIDPGNNTSVYTPDCFDIFMLDLYLTDSTSIGYNMQQMKRAIYNKYINVYKRTSGKKRPKRFIPMLPLFAQSNGSGGYTWNMPTASLLTTMMDVYSTFGITDYAVFGFNIPWDSSFTTIENDTTLQRYSNLIRSSIYTTKQDINFIYPINFKMHKNYVSSTNMSYGSAYGNLYVPTGNASGNVIYRVQRENQSTEIYYHCLCNNQGGSTTHTINVYISYDGTSWQPAQTFSLAPTSGVTFPSATDSTNILSFPIDYNVAYVKFELVYNGTPGTDNAIGFQEIGCTAI